MNTYAIENIEQNLRIFAFNFEKRKIRKAYIYYSSLPFKDVFEFV